MRSLIISMFTAASVVSSPWVDTTSERDLRAAERAYDRGDFESAARTWQLYQTEVTDPSFVAYNRGIVALLQQDYASAEQHFLNAMNDSEAPPSRRADAMFHRAVALIGLSETPEHCLEAIRLIRTVSQDVDSTEELRSKSSFYIELAKQKLDELRKQRRSQQMTTPDAGDENSAQQTTTSTVTTAPMKPPTMPPVITEPVRNPSTPPTETTQKTPGSGSAPVTPPEPWPQTLTKEQGQDWVNKIAERLKQARLQQAEVLAGPERKNIRDW